MGAPRLDFVRCIYFAVENYVPFLHRYLIHQNTVAEMQCIVWPASISPGRGRRTA
jgi:hypothetical protein